MNNERDPHGILAPGNLPPLDELCPACRLRYPGALGHGPPCGCPGSEAMTLIAISRVLLQQQKEDEGETRE